MVRNKVSSRASSKPSPRYRPVAMSRRSSVSGIAARDCAVAQGRLSQAVMERVCLPEKGLFPSPREIKFSCSCADWAGMCKHVAAVLYGVGARLDARPELLFSLRGVGHTCIIASAKSWSPQQQPILWRLCARGRSRPQHQ
jgi:uncharacterized Zn finger protein